MQTDKQKQTETNRQTDEQTNKHTYIHIHIRTYVHTYIYLHIYIDIGLHAACVWNGGATSGNTTHDCLDLRVREKRITPPKKTKIINPTARFRRSSLLLQPADGRNLLGSPSVVLGRDDDAMNCRMDEWWWMACVHIHMHLCTHIYIYIYIYIVWNVLRSFPAFWIIAYHITTLTWCLMRRLTSDFGGISPLDGLYRCTRNIQPFWPLG